VSADNLPDCVTLNTANFTAAVAAFGNDALPASTRLRSFRELSLATSVPITPNAVLPLKSVHPDALTSLATSAIVKMAATGVHRRPQGAAVVDHRCGP